MLFRRLTFFVLLAYAIPLVAVAQSAEDSPSPLLLELNAIQDVADGCRMTFLVRNETSIAIDKAVFEAVIFDTSGGVVKLSLFDFRDLPADRPRVRQFDLPGMACETLEQALINGASSCIVDGAESAVCHDQLTVSSRIAVDLLG
ncbi:MAG: hypothetical protein ABJI96_06150 [Paracoccaceae bacterium]